MTTPYVPTPGVFVDGSIIDAADFLNEFGLVASKFSEVDATQVSSATATLAAAKTYTDTKLQSYSVDGGTF